MEPVIDVTCVRHEPTWRVLIWAEVVEYPTDIVWRRQCSAASASDLISVVLHPHLRTPTGTVRVPELAGVLRGVSGIEVHPAIIVNFEGHDVAVGLEGPRDYRAAVVVVARAVEDHPAAARDERNELAAKAGIGRVSQRLSFRGVVFLGVLTAPRPVTVKIGSPAPAY